MTAKETAKADTQDVSKPKKREPITNARLIRIPRGDLSYPAAVYKGDVPSKGEKLTFKLTNRVSYTGIVHDATEVDGEVVCEFRTGLTPVQSK